MTPNYAGFHAVNIPMTWSDAQSFCHSTFSASLASIHNMQDFDASVAAATVIDADYVWIGLNDIASEASQMGMVGNYSWTDGSPFDFGTDISGGVFPWDTSQPLQQLYDSNDDCIVAWSANGYKWNDLPCHGNTFPFICSTIPTTEPTKTPSQSTNNPT